MSVQDEIDRLTTRRAAEWFEIYRTGQAEHFPAFITWLSEAPQKHLTEFLEIAGRYPAIRNALQNAMRDGVFDQEALLKRVRPAVRSIQEADIQPRAAEPGSPIKRRWRWGWGLAASFIVAGVLAWYGVTHHLGVQRFETQTGEQRTVSLVDGSILTLNAQSVAEVRIDGQRRDIELTRGEAMFKVAHDRQRPFIVYTRGATVRAVGTQFNVYAKSDGSTAVAVLEGRVEISATDAAGSAEPPDPAAATARTNTRTPLSAGQSASIGQTGLIERDLHADLGKVVAWRQRRLIFDRTPLEQIVPEFNRYNRGLRIRLENIPSGSFRFSGSFDADDPHSLALLLSHEPDLAVEERVGEIVVRQRQSAE